MIFIPYKAVPYVLIVLGVFGAVYMTMNDSAGSSTGDRIFGIVTCTLAAIGGVAWLVLKKRRGRR